MKVKVYGQTYNVSEEVLKQARQSMSDWTDCSVAKAKYLAGEFDYSCAVVRVIGNIVSGRYCSFLEVEIVETEVNPLWRHLDSS